MVRYHESKRQACSPCSDEQNSGIFFFIASFSLYLTCNACLSMADGGSEAGRQAGKRSRGAGTRLTSGRASGGRRQNAQATLAIPDDRRECAI